MVKLKPDRRTFARQFLGPARDGDKNTVPEILMRGEID